MINERSTPAPARRAYIAPEVVHVHVDPVTELLQQTQCNFEPPGGGNPGCDNPC